MIDDLEDMEDPTDSEILCDILGQFPQYAHMKQRLLRIFQRVFLAHKVQSLDPSFVAD